ncbi:unnamed protein product [Ilex paraguariensis]|uniref:Uncharacterized protein n=1 Tax=Ilex paraguariensis TaxID=185542 RepID=A0ABC8RHA7_9AQUA
MMLFRLPTLGSQRLIKSAAIRDTEDAPIRGDSSKTPPNSTCALNLGSGDCSPFGVMFNKIGE